MWIAREDSTSAELTDILNAARDRGLAHCSEIAAHESRLLDIPADLAESYLRDNLHFELGPREQAGLRHFYDLCVKHNQAPPGRETAFTKSDHNETVTSPEH
jgi:predicted solute-binding protein